MPGDNEVRSVISRPGRRASLRGCQKSDAENRVAYLVGNSINRDARTVGSGSSYRETKDLLDSGNGMAWNPLKVVC